MIEFSKSKNYKSEYCCTVVQLGQVIPIVDSDFLATTTVEGRTIVVRKDQCHEGDILFYSANETQLNYDFLSVNNLYTDKTLNMDPEKKGYFNKYGRVRMIKLRGVYSMGYLFGFKELKNWCPNLTEEDIPEIGSDFDTINGELFVKAYVPPKKEGTPRASNEKKRNKKIKRFNRMIPGEFSFHYDTQQLNREIERIEYNDIVTISVKLHGTSFIIGNVLVNQPKWNGLYYKYFNYLPKFLQFTKQEHDIIYSSRAVIKNQFINSGVTDGYYGTDIWDYYYQILKNYIPKGFTIYGEIVGYVPGSNQMIQKGFDYGCKPGENKLMIYRISRVFEGKKYEYNVMDVKGWTLKLIDSLKEDGHTEIAEKIHVIDILYHGTLSDLYPNIPIDEYWHENVLEAIKNDKTTFGMELYEPLCRNKTPREGIVLRIDDDPINEAFKLKCLKFLGKEADLVDKGEIDLEMEETFYA